MKTNVGPWICDTCGQEIETVEQGWVEWLQNEEFKAYGFRIVHHALYSPFKPRRNCYNYEDKGMHDLPLNKFIGSTGLAQLLCFLDEGEHVYESYGGPTVKDIREFLDFFRRVQIPYYEQARFHLRDELEGGQLAGCDAAYIYSPDSLKGLIERCMD